MPTAAARLAGMIAKLPIHAYRWTLRPWVGWECRHLPTCSDYALDAIDCHGAWRGGWMTMARLCRCHPWGTHGCDPVPKVVGNQHPWAPWRYGRWSWRVLQSPGQAPNPLAADRPASGST
jgi:uncharacterized protein